MEEKLNHPYSNLKIFFGTKHGKEKAINEAFADSDLSCVAAEIDTDEFGTFSGEKERTGSVYETLQKKIKAVFDLHPDARLALASEGSFGMHPIYGFIPCDHESLLFVDRELGIEILVDEISTNTNCDSIEIGPQDLYEIFLNQISFPTHGLILKNSRILKKGIQNQIELSKLIKNTFLEFPDEQITLMTDMRASLNPTRMKVIQELALKLSEQLFSFCPDCSTIGFGPKENVIGLHCSCCGRDTLKSKGSNWKCIKCNYNEFQPREDGTSVADPGECQFCNP